MHPHEALNPQRQVQGIRLAAQVVRRLLRVPVPAWWLLVVLAVMIAFCALVLSLVPRRGDAAAQTPKWSPLPFHVSNADLEPRPTHVTQRACRPHAL
ncbi:MAG: hypothetical protein M3179_07895 [Actinomycetota bacterium]|nr:hypothetical protein [Actinomycetota bacterium]